MNIKNNFNIGKRIRELRVENGLSQEQLALRSDITTAYLGLLERNLKNPTVKVIEQICNSLNISLVDFFTAAPISTNFQDTLSLQILAQISDRTDEEKKIILQMIKAAIKLSDLSFPKNHDEETKNSR